MVSTVMIIILSLDFILPLIIIYIFPEGTTVENNIFILVLKNGDVDILSGMMLKNKCLLNRKPYYSRNSSNVIEFA
jgi:hypothetical protein